jgi:steroid 5-alpha reductase family enzyme
VLPTTAPVTVLATVVAAPGRDLWIAALAVAGLMLALWALSLPLRDVSIVDVAWGPALALVGLIAALTSHGDPARRWLLCGLSALWSIRLALHIGARKRAEPGEDRRYASMRGRRGAAFPVWSLGMIFGLQGSLVLVISLPLQVAARRPAPLSAAIVPGLVLFGLGLAFEAVGDEQLRRFKASPASQGRVMDRGLWRYTRHPNYFGDTCVWWGLWLVALPAGGTWWTALGPAVMTFLLVRVSGKAMLERSIGKRRPEYADYVRRTSGFVPLPPRTPQQP